MSEGGILWAVDPYDADPSLGLQALAGVLALSAAPGSIEPVYVATGGRTGEASDRLARWLSHVDRPGLLAGRVIVPKGESRSGAVEALVEYAVASGAALIAVATHGRRGIRRLVDGSFAEALVERSAIPVLVLNPSSRPPDRVEYVLFPTDLSPMSHDAFERAVRIAGELGAKILLFHHIGILRGASRAEVRERACEWIDLARASGVPARCHVTYGPHQVAGELLRLSDKIHGTLLAVGTEVGRPWGHAFDGNVRDLIRNASRPVLLLPVERGPAERRPRRTSAAAVPLLS